MSVASRKFELFYDVISPYAWIAFETLCRYHQKWNLDLVLRPVFFGGVIKGSENVAPGMYPLKVAYMSKDIVRLSKHYNIPFKFPKEFVTSIAKKGALPAMRFITAVDMIDGQAVRALSRELWMRRWSRDQDITEPQSLSEAASVIGLSDKVIMAAHEFMKSDKVKDRLRATTQEALDRGAFGVPTMVFNDKTGKQQMIFGSDRMHIIADLLGTKYDGPLANLGTAV